MESHEETLVKIQKFENQKAEIESLLSADPNNAQYIELHKNISIAIDLTSKLLHSNKDDSGDVDADGKPVFIQMKAISRNFSKQFEVGVCTLNYFENEKQFKSINIYMLYYIVTNL